MQPPEPGPFKTTGVSVYTWTQLSSMTPPAVVPALQHFNLSANTMTTTIRINSHSSGRIIYIELIEEMMQFVVFHGAVMPKAIASLPC